MLKGLDPLLTPELLSALRAMGHGDEIVVVDGNYPANAAGPPVIRLDGVPAPTVLDAILSVMPLDDFVSEAAWCMAVVGEPDADAPIYGDFRQALIRNGEQHVSLTKLERFAFYAKAADAFAIVVTGERRLYGNVILKKGIVRPN